MRVVTNDDDLDVFLKTAAVVSRDHPVVISKYITGAKERDEKAFCRLNGVDVEVLPLLQEVEMDAIGNNGDLVNYAIAEHIEKLGERIPDCCTWSLEETTANEQYALDWIVLVYAKSYLLWSLKV